MEGFGVTRGDLGSERGIWCGASLWHNLSHKVSCSSYGLYMFETFFILKLIYLHTDSHLDECVN